MFISVKAVEWVFENSKSSGNSRNVLTVIASHCDSDGCAWPSLDSVTDKERYHFVCDRDFSFVCRVGKRGKDL